MAVATSYATTILTHVSSAAGGSNVRANSSYISSVISYALAGRLLFLALRRSLRTSVAASKK
jgi:hypothetical protein